MSRYLCALLLGTLLATGVSAQPSALAPQPNVYPVFSFHFGPTPSGECSPRNLRKFQRRLDRLHPEQRQYWENAHTCVTRIGDFDGDGLYDSFSLHSHPEFGPCNPNGSPTVNENRMFMSFGDGRPAVLESWKGGHVGRYHPDADKNGRPHVLVEEFRYVGRPSFSIRGR